MRAGRPQKSLTRPLRSQSPKRVGSGPAGPPISFGMGCCGLGMAGCAVGLGGCALGNSAAASGVGDGRASVVGLGSLSGVCVMAILM